MLLDLALVIAHQLRCSARNAQLARLLDLGLEGHLVAVAPHLGLEGLPGDDGASEADLDVLEWAEPELLALQRLDTIGGTHVS